MDLGARATSGGGGRATRRHCRPSRTLLAFAIAAGIAIPGTSAAQRGRPSAGPYIPLGSRMDRIVSWLVHEGALAPVNPLVRPFRMGAVRAAVASEDTLLLSEGGRRALRTLASDLVALDDSILLFADAGLSHYATGRRDTFRPGGRRGTATSGGLYGALVADHVVAVANPAFDNRLRDDPQYTGKTDRVIAGRNQEGYVAFLSDRFDLSYGRMSRNWGPDLFDGLLLSPSAYAHDAVAGSLRVGRFEIESVAQRIDDARDPADSLGTPLTRFFFAHRLSVRASSRVWLSFVESGVYSGKGRGVEPTLHAPLNLALLSEFNESLEANVLLGMDALVRLGARSTVEASGYLDDIQVDRTKLADRRPTSYGLTVVGRTASRDAPWHLALGYTRVSSLAYRNSFAPETRYTYRGIGIARDFADYDQWLARAETQRGGAFRAGFEATYIRQGAGDFRDPFPSDSALAQPGMGFLLAPVTRLWGIRATLSGEPARGIVVRSELGLLHRGGGGTSAIVGLSLGLQADVLRRRMGAPLAAVQTGADRDWP